MSRIGTLPDCRAAPHAVPSAAKGRRAPGVVDDFAQLRQRLLALVARRAPQDDAETDAIRRQIGLSDRAFGELWAACSCNGDFAARRRASGS